MEQNKQSQDNVGCSIRPSLDQALQNLLNSYSVDNGSNTPDFILSEYMLNSLRNFEQATKDREKWYGIAHSPCSQRR